MRFTKMQGLGNDFVVIEGPDPDIELIIALCDRRFGVGGDGVLAVDASPRMRYWNADGSPAEMCGNGLRCVARYAVNRGWESPNEWFSIATPVGSRRARVSDAEVTVEIGPVALGETVVVADREARLVDVGNPHAVITVDDPDGVDVDTVGYRIGTDSQFPRGTNVEFVNDLGDGSVRMRVWERGVGETLACGSGMVAAAFAAAQLDDQPVVVHMPGGSATVSLIAGSAYLTGPAETVYRGDWPVNGDGEAR